MGRKGYIVLTNTFRKEGRRWLGRCEELGTSVFGRSLPEAEKVLDEAIGLHLNTLEDIGELERFINEHKIQFHRLEPKHDINICVPLQKDVFVHPHIQRVPAPSLT